MPLLLAEFSPLSPSAQLAIVSILSLLLIVLSIRAMIRRDPSLDTHLAKFEASIATLTKSVNELTESQKLAADHSTRIRALESEAVAIRAAHTQCSMAHRSDQTRVTREWFDRIEKVESGMAKNFQTIEGAIGRIEGQLTILVADR